jgi:hypothetical protein
MPPGLSVVVALGARQSGIAERGLLSIALFGDVSGHFGLRHHPHAITLRDHLLA